MILAVLEFFGHVFLLWIPITGGIDFGNRNRMILGKS